MGGSEKVKTDSGDMSEADGMQSISTYRGVPVEVELSRRYLTQVEDQHGEPAIQMQVQEQSQTSGGRNSSVGVALYKPQYTIRRPIRYGIDEAISYALITTNGDPKNYAKAMENNDKESLTQVMMEEMESLKKNQTWQLMDLPKGARSISLKQMFTKKEAPLE